MIQLQKIVPISRIDTLLKLLKDHLAAGREHLIKEKLMMAGSDLTTNDRNLNVMLFYSHF